MVTVERVEATELEQKVQDAKDAGRRILAVSPASLHKLKRVGMDFEVVSYVLVTQ